MLTLNKLFLALAFLGGSAAAQAADSNADRSPIDHGRNSRKSTGLIVASTARLFDANPAMSSAYASRSSSLSEGPDNYLPVHHRL